MSLQYQRVGEVNESEDLSSEAGLMFRDEGQACGHRRSMLYKINLVVLIIVGCCMGAIWLLKGCLEESGWKLNETQATTLEPSSVYLVKNQAPSSPISSATGVLECFQVHQPVTGPSYKAALGGKSEETALSSEISFSNCDVVLMKTDFAYSYGAPFVGKFYYNLNHFFNLTFLGNYTPPNCKFNRVTINFTVTSKGRQFDRLALMYFNDTEVWRTSTAEPTTDGIIWTYVKDMTPFLYLWNSPQKLIFDLGNIVDDTYTGIWHTTLTATFSTVEETTNPAALIIPISARRSASDAASLFTLPAETAINNVTLPRNTNRAVFSISACGQAAEEFWWGNVLSSNTDTFIPLAGQLYGYSPFREVQLYIDGQLAGVQWPFPTIFTGGVVPGLWRPIVGLDAFDLKEGEIDITPWLGHLCDGGEHTFEIKVAGVLEDGKGSGSLTQTVGASWYITGKIFLWLDSDPSSITRGAAPTTHQPTPHISTSSLLTQSAGVNETLEYTTSVSRSLTLSSQLTTQAGTRLASWTQTLSVSNYGLYTAAGAVQVTDQTTRGADLTASGYSKSYSYPLWANTTYLPGANSSFTLDAVVRRGLDATVTGASVFGAGVVQTTQNGSAHYASVGGKSSGFGSTSQVFQSLGEGGREVYFRDVEAVNATVVRDREVVLGVETGAYAGVAQERQVVLGMFSPKEAIGRGPGAPRPVLVQGGA